MDIVIISCGKHNTHRTLTQNAVNSCLNSGVDFRIIVIETCKDVKYQHCETHYFEQKDKFNYNRCLNYGMQISKDKYVALCNNDLVFHKDWAKNIINAMESSKLNSACPFDKGYHLNYKEAKPYNLQPGSHIYKNNQVRVFFVGWCFVIDRTVWAKIGSFNEGVDFYFSDDIVVEQYKKHDISHALVANSYVDHYNGGEKTWRVILCKSKQRYYTGGQQHKFNNAKTKLWST